MEEKVDPDPRTVIEEKVDPDPRTVIEGKVDPDPRTVIGEKVDPDLDRNSRVKSEVLQLPKQHAVYYCDYHYHYML
jgi:hypothetical protein